MNERSDAGQILWRRRRRGGTEWILAQAACARARSGKGHGERLLGRNAERPAYAESRAGRKFREEFATVGVQPVTGANNQILYKLRRPRNTNPRFKYPLASGQG